MADPTEIVTVNVTVQDQTASRDDFGTLLAVTYHELGPGMRTYNTSAAGRTAAIADGFTETSDFIYKLDAVRAQSPRVSLMKVWPRALENVQTITLTVGAEGAVEGYKYDFLVNDTAIVYTVLAGATTSTVAAALEPLIEAAGGVDASVTTNVITVTCTDPEVRRVFFRNVPRALVLEDTSADAGIATDLAAALAADPDWFAFVIDGQGELEGNAAAAWAQSNARQFIHQSADSEVHTAGSSDVASDFVAAAYKFAKVLVTKDMKGQAAASLLGRQLSRAVGSSWAHLKELPGALPDNWNATEFGLIENKGAIAYAIFSGLNRTHEPYNTSLRFMDITRNMEWLKSTMRANILTLLATQEIVTYTPAGIAQVQSVVESTLAQAAALGVIIAAGSAGGFTVTVPEFSTVPQVDKANRILRNINFTATLQGAIGQVQSVEGTVTV
jgi:hypothetical protein